MLEAPFIIVAFPLPEALGVVYPEEAFEVLKVQLESLIQSVGNEPEPKVIGP